MIQIVSGIATLSRISASQPGRGYLIHPYFKYPLPTGRLRPPPNDCSPRCPESNKCDGIRGSRQSRPVGVARWEMNRCCFCLRRHTCSTDVLQSIAPSSSGLTCPSRHTRQCTTLARFASCSTRQQRGAYRNYCIPDHRPCAPHPDTVTNVSSSPELYPLLPRPVHALESCS